MAKITTIIDIGSNSLRMVVLQKSSRYAYSLINESKSKVKISEGCYENNGNLQEIPMQRAYESLKSFLNISKSLKATKIICVATSALRDAPNSKIFLNKIKHNLGLKIKIIDGEKEAYYGGVAASNLLYENNFITVDIGGGSTEFSLVENGVIQKSISINIGTVRLKELYFNKNDLEGAKKYILDSLKLLNFNIPKTVVGIGGTVRALSRAIIKKTQYPLDVIHGFSYNPMEHMEYFENISKIKKINELKYFNLKKDRFDTIIEGTYIFKTILEELKISKVITSGVGVREGVYLCDLLRSNNCKFPANFNVSVRSLLDRFELDKDQSVYLGKNASKIFDSLKSLHKLDDRYKYLLMIASKLHSLGSALNFYKTNINAFEFILNGLNYNFTHSSRIMVAYAVKFSKKSLPKEEDVKDHISLLPNINVLRWLSFMLSLNLSVNLDYSKPKVEYIIENDTICLKLPNKTFMIDSNLKKLETPDNLKLKILDL